MVGSGSRVQLSVSLPKLIDYYLQDRPVASLLQGFKEFIKNALGELESRFPLGQGTNVPESSGTAPASLHS